MLTPPHAPSSIDAFFLLEKYYNDTFHCEESAFQCLQMQDLASMAGTERVVPRQIVSHSPSIDCRTYPPIAPKSVLMALPPSVSVERKKFESNPNHRLSEQYMQDRRVYASKTRDEVKACIKALENSVKSKQENLSPAQKNQTLPYVSVITSRTRGQSFDFVFPLSQTPGSILDALHHFYKTKIEEFKKTVEKSDEQRKKH